MELVLYGLVEFDVINKDILELSLFFRDFLVNMLDDDDFFGDLQKLVELYVVMN